jgi:N-sulfoglucosamine sulfohydrolase
MQQINRRHLLAGAGAFGTNLLGQTPAARPNIIYVHSHDTGRYIQPYGHAVPTPNLQKLAEEGVLFRQAFCAGPTCSPSRAALLTGQCPHSSGMIGLAHRGFRLNDPKQHLAHTLRVAGYTTVLAGIQHVANGKDVEGLGYDKMLNSGGRAPKVAEAAAGFLKSRPKTPFFLDAGFAETHREYPVPSAKEDERYCLPPAAVPDTPETRHDMAQFKAAARVMDQAVGDILAALEAAGLADNTLVISTTDHGIAFPAMKCNLSDHGMGIMLLMRGPGGFRGGKACDAMISHIDIFPTICDLLGIAHPAWLQGKSLVPLMNGKAKEIHDEVFAEVSYHAAYEPKRAVRTKRWKYTRRFDALTHPNLPNCDDGLSKSVWLEQGWRGQPVAKEELFDLLFDPAEHRNLVAEPAQRGVLTEMRGRLDSWMKRTADPLLHGPVKTPPGAVVNDPEGTSPKEKTVSAG